MGESSRIPSNHICAAPAKDMLPLAAQDLSVTRKMPLSQDVDGSHS